MVRLEICENSLHFPEQPRTLAVQLLVDSRTMNAEQPAQVRLLNPIGDENVLESLSSHWGHRSKVSPICQQPVYASPPGPKIVPAVATWRERLAAHLERQDLSQSELGRRLSRAGIPTKRGSVHNWLNDKRGIDLDTFAKICDVLGLSADTLLGLKHGETVKVARADLDALLAHLQTAQGIANDYVVPRAAEVERSAGEAATTEPSAEGLVGRRRGRKLKSRQGRP